MHDRKRQRASRQSNKPNRDDFAAILHEIRFAHEQAGRLPNRADVRHIASMAAGDAVVMGASAGSPNSMRSCWPMRRPSTRAST
jgi:hypothetical protein